MTDRKETLRKITDELAQQPKNGEDADATESSKLRRAEAEKEINESKRSPGSTKS